MHLFIVFSVLFASFVTASASSSNDFQYKLNHFFDGSDPYIKVRFMPELTKDWYIRYFTAVRNAGYDLNTKLRDKYTLFIVAVNECNPGMVGALLEIGVTTNPEAHVRNIYDEDCKKVHKILVAAGFHANGHKEESEDDSSDMDEDEGEEDEEEGEEVENSQNEGDSKMEESDSNDESESKGQLEVDSSSMNVQCRQPKVVVSKNYSTAHNCYTGYEDIDGALLNDLLNSPIVGDDIPPPNAVPIQTLYRVQIPMRIDVAPPHQGVVFTPF